MRELETRQISQPVQKIVFDKFALGVRVFPILKTLGRGPSGSAMNTTPTPSITKEVFILDGAGETLVLLGIVILEANLKVDSFRELSFLRLR